MDDSEYEVVWLFGCTFHFVHRNKVREKRASSALHLVEGHDVKLFLLD